MHRLWIAICILCGVVLLAAALLVPAHSRAVEAQALEAAGKRSPGLVEEGIRLVKMEKVGPARMLLMAAQGEKNVKSADRLTAAILQFSQEHPNLTPWGGADPSIEKANVPKLTAEHPAPFVNLVMQRDVREKLIEFLRGRASSRPGLAHFLNNRTLTNTIHFPPSSTASGQAFDGAVITAGLLYQGDHMSTPLAETLEFLAMRANRGDADSLNSLELAYLDLVSLGRRLDWVSLVELMRKVEDLSTMGRLAEAARTHEEQFSAVFAAVLLSNQPKHATEFMHRFPQTGLNDLSFAAGTGLGGTEMLLKQQQRIVYPSRLKSTLVNYDPFGWWFHSLLPMVQNNPRGALLLKYFLLLIGGLCVARAIGVVAGTTQWHGLRFGADTVLALAIAFILALFSEPFVGLPNQIRDLPIRFHIPMAAIAPGSSLQTVQSVMNNNEMSLLPLIIFFVLQALIYIWCLAKISEIRRQPLAASMKLKLLENEDHLFDAGLYIGFVGTIIALIMFSLGIAKFSLMSAYSSTSFGIIFVSVLKIFHVRPMRRKLIIESEVA